MRKLISLFTLLLSCACWADTITLVDGTQLTGDLKRVETGWSITQADGTIRTVPADSVKAVQLGSSAPRAGLQATDALASLRRSVEALPDIDQIIDRYQRFIDTTNDATVVSEARSELALWQDRKRQQLVKYGGQWVTAAQVNQLVSAATEQAIQARDMIRQTRTHDAEQLVRQALMTDPNNLSALYLNGVLLYRQDKLVEARKVFETINERMPAYPPALNNIAVILWRQKQAAASLNFYDQAMKAAGVNDFILNNVAEALGTVPDEARRSAAAANASRRFAELDQLLQRDMAKRGMYRWGSSWIDDKHLETLKTAERETREKMTAMQQEYDRGQARINSLDSQISQNQRAMEDLRLNSYYRDANGSVVMLPPPQSYYDLQNQNNQLQTEADSLRGKFASYPDQAQKLQRELPIPTFTGVQQIVGVEAMPLPAPTSQPASSNPAGGS